MGFNPLGGLLISKDPPCTWRRPAVSRTAESRRRRGDCISLQTTHLPARTRAALRGRVAARPPRAALKHATTRELMRPARPSASRLTRACRCSSTTALTWRSRSTPTAPTSASPICRPRLRVRFSASAGSSGLSTCACPRPSPGARPGRARRLHRHERGHWRRTKDTRRSPRSAAHGPARNRRPGAERRALRGGCDRRDPSSERDRRRGAGRGRRSRRLRYPRRCRLAEAARDATCLTRPADDGATCTYTAPNPNPLHHLGNVSGTFSQKICSFCPFHLLCLIESPPLT